MLQRSKTTRVILALIAGAGFVAPAAAASYDATKLTHISMNTDGTVFIKWTGSPVRTCSGQENYGWVKIRPTTNEAVRALALSIHFSSARARIDTSGCDGPYEAVTALYTPGG